MSDEAETTDFDPEDCLCQMKVVPEDKRVDFDVIVTDPKTGKHKIKTILRYHKDCDIHGIEVMNA